MAYLEKEAQNKQEIELVNQLKALNALKHKIDKKFSKATAQILENKQNGGNLINELRFEILQEVMNTPYKDCLLQRLEKPVLTPDLTQTLNEIKSNIQSLMKNHS